MKSTPVINLIGFDTRDINLQIFTIVTEGDICVNMFYLHSFSNPFKMIKGVIDNVNYIF